MEMYLRRVFDACLRSCDASDHDLANHIMSSHSPSEGSRITCPICASQPHGNPSYRSSNIFGHIETRHSQLLSDEHGAVLDEDEFSPMVRAPYGMYGAPPSRRMPRTCHRLPFRRCC